MAGNKRKADDGNGLASGEYSVLLPIKTYDAIIRGKRKSGWLKLKNVYWFTDDNKRVLQEIAAKSWGYGKDCIIRIENIERIFPLSAEGIKNIPKR